MSRNSRKPKKNEVSVKVVQDKQVNFTMNGLACETYDPRKGSLGCRIYVRHPLIPGASCYLALQLHFDKALNTPIATLTIPESVFGKVVAGGMGVLMGVNYDKAKEDTSSGQDGPIGKNAQLPSRKGRKENNLPSGPQGG